MSTLMDKKMNEEDFFSSRKHLTDSLNVSKSRCFSVNKEYTAKKLALPKIHGKYKVLDRYDSIEINWFFEYCKHNLNGLIKVLNIVNFIKNFIKF